MTKYILLYKGPATPPDKMDEEKMQGIMQAWKDWMSKLGESLIDIGNPMFNGISVVDDGSDGIPDELSGFSIIQAENIDDAKEMIKDHPFLVDKTGKFSVEIFELADAPM